MCVFLSVQDVQACVGEQFIELVAAGVGVSQRIPGAMRVKVPEQQRIPRQLVHDRLEVLDQVGGRRRQVDRADDERLVVERDLNCCHLYFRALEIAASMGCERAVDEHGSATAGVACRLRSVRCVHGVVAEEVATADSVAI